MTAIKPGDIVCIGRSTLTWEVTVMGKTYARLRSGQTGRQRTEPLSNLRKHPYQKEAQ